MDKYSKEQFEEYVKNNGFITDELEAIDLLCKTPFAWYALDESLKSNPTVILYYQPFGLAKYIHKEHISAGAWLYCLEEVDEVEWPTYDAWKTIPQKGFKLIKGDYQIPDIDFPEGFDIELYKRIQNELRGAWTEGSVYCDIDKFEIESVKKEHYSKDSRYEIIEYYRPYLASAVKYQIKENKRKHFVY